MAAHFLGTDQSPLAAPRSPARPPLIVFDLGRVLIRICDDWRHACEVAGVPAPRGEMTADQRRALHEAVCRSETGALDLEGFAEAASKIFGIDTDHVVALSNAFLLGPFDGAAELLDELGDAGFTTACLSNTNASHWIYLTDPSGPHYPVLGRLHHRFASHLIGHRKPDAGCYAHVEQTAGRGANEIIFFDDIEENISAANARGWRAFQIHPKINPTIQIRQHLHDAGIVD